jgi:hypothetical protein
MNPASWPLIPARRATPHAAPLRWKSCAKEAGARARFFWKSEGDRREDGELSQWGVSADTLAAAHGVDPDGYFHAMDDLDVV